MNMKLMYLTASEELAIEAQNAGIDRIFLDLEYINKLERQKGRNTVVSNNTIEDVSKLKKVINKADLLVRVNPINPLSKNEINRVINDGADIVMLPMVIDSDDVKRLVEFVDRRAKVLPMIETSQALTRIDDILEVDGVDEIFIGLNDLHISMGLSFMFELLSGGIVEYMSKKIKAKGLPFGFGGIAKIGEGALPAEVILGEHYRLGSNSVILSRTFRNEIGDNKGKIDLDLEIKKLRDREREVKNWTQKEFTENKFLAKECVGKVVNKVNL